jgi:hypothetical protein
MFNGLYDVDRSSIHQARDERVSAVYDPVGTGDGASACTGMQANGHGPADYAP